jgi:CheY-like chemotaxis protein
MVYGFVKRSGGGVRIFSEIGHGTTVSLYLPIVANLSHSISTANPQTLAEKLAETIPVMDCRAGLPEAATVYPGEMGLRTLKVKDSASSLKATTQSTPIDLIIPDIVIPGGTNGAEPVDGIQRASLGQRNESRESKAVTQNILVVDDDSAIGEFVCATAKPMGFQCTVTTDAKTLLEKLSADTTLILLDLMMPEMDGIELLRLFGQQKCKAGIVLMSGVNTRTIEAAEQFGQVLGLSIVGYLQKPLQKAELEEILQRFPSPNPPTTINDHPPFAIHKKDLEASVIRLNPAIRDRVKSGHRERQKT